jgi:hypothetical protein
VVAYLMLFGVGWTQRWRLVEGSETAVAREVDRLGRDEVGHLRVIDPGTDAETTVVVAWRHVVSAVILGAEAGHVDETAPGQYP